uniref:Uncharacterized protein n=1 Tax=Entomoneis paludosa TaxID=265537 RepID=A0A7S2YEE7_9STRA|mmetsp:Transcript_29412/g.61507  ORF Transcript_29412/g.61507 Transcript_29412/m.61507 type:complete len:338 (+) Transcript_29412:106-1119(+)
MPKREDDPLLPNEKAGSRSNHHPQVKDLFSMHSQGNMDSTLNWPVQPETLRFYAYVFFWIMGFLAMALTELVVKDRLAAGPPPGDPSCPPFEMGQGGFDLHTHSHLIRVYGFNNICSNWDYSPAREIVAMVYPLFEYTLILYLVADFINVAISYQKGWVSPRYYRVARTLFPIMLILCSWFRMIFVILVYEDARGHTAGFLGLQLTLMMVACLNVWYISETKLEYDILGGRRGTQIASLIYLVCDLAVSATKFWLDVHVVLGYDYPSWGMKPVGSLVVGECVDHVWMLFNAILPLIISYVRSQKEQPLEITIDLQAPKYILQRIREQEKEANEPPVP